MAKSNKSEVISLEAEEVALTPDQLNIINKKIDSQLVKANITDQLIGKFEKEYGVLEISGIKDTDGYNAVYDARITCKNTRILAIDICKTGRAPSQAETKAWIAKQKEVVARISKIEEDLQAKQNVIDNEKERVKAEKIRLEGERLKDRMAILQKLGATTDGVDVISGSVNYSIEVIRETDQDIFDFKILPKYKEVFEANELVRLEEEKKKADEDARISKEKKDFEDQQTAFRKQQQELKEAQDKLDKEKKDKEDAEEKQKQNAIVTRTKDRADELDALGLGYNFQQEAFQIGIGRISIPHSLLVAKTDAEWNEFIDAWKPKIAEAKNTLQKEQDAQDKLKADLAAESFLQQKKEKERLEEVKRQQEIEEGKESVKYSEIVKYLKAAPMHYSFRSGRYITKVREIKDFLADLD